MSYWLSGAFSAVLSAGLIFLIRRYAIQRSILAEPNARSSHAVPTPLGGGIGIVAAFFVTLALAAGSELRDWRILAMLGAVALIAWVGWRDDKGGLSVRWRLFVHCVAGGLLVPYVIAGVHGPWPAVGVALLTVFGTVTAINVVNFIDGIDGLIGLQAVVLGLHFALPIEVGGYSTLFGVLLCGAALGFLVWNRPPARIFMGDAGSGAIGVLVVAGGALMMHERGSTIVAAFLPLAPIFADASTTLLRRAIRRERLTEAHRTHLYQRLAAKSMGHGPVSMIYGVAAAAGAAAVRMPAGILLFVIVGYLVALLCVGVVLDRKVGH